LPPNISLHFQLTAEKRAFVWPYRIIAHKFLQYSNLCVLCDLGGYAPELEKSKKTLHLPKPIKGLKIVDNTPPAR